MCAADFRATTAAAAAEKDGYPIHEVVGEVIASRHPEHRPGDRVVGWASAFDGLMERVVTDGDQVAPYDPALTPAQAIGLQPLACVLYAVEQLPALDGRHVGIIGQGSIGLLFSYAAKAAGARRVTGIDPVDRTDVAAKFGVDTIVRATSDRWVSQLAREDRPDIVIEAVGHQVATLNHAIEAAGRRWHRLLLRRRRRRQLSDQHAHHAAQQPDAEIRCDT